MPNVFISYRRPADARHTSLAVRLGAALQVGWQAHGQVFVDVTAVIDQKKFATNLVDDGLNQSLALIAIIDDAWLDPGNVGRLIRGGDWVAFELSYAVENRLCIVLVGSGDNRHRFDATPLAGSLAGLRDATWFEWRDGLPFDPQLQALTRLLRLHLPAHSRRPSVLRAKERHNQPNAIGIDEAESRYAGARPAYLLLEALDFFGSGLFFVGGLIALGGVVSTLFYSLLQGLLAVAGGAALMALWWLLHRARCNHLAQYQTPRR